MDNISYFISLFPKYISDIFNGYDLSLKRRINEIRLRRNKPIILYLNDTAYFVEVTGALSQSYSTHCLCLCDDDFNTICDKLCNNSYHTKMTTLVDGYVTAKNGSRVGVACSAVIKDGVIHSVRDISSLNIRISHEYINTAKPIVDLICTENCPSIIVAGRPACGKTTFLRDYARLLSNGYTGEYKKVSVIDERREIAGQFDVGFNTDIISGFGKAQGIEIATRTLSPDIIICDEIGNFDELDAIVNSFACGVSFAVSLHIRDESQILSNRILTELIATNQFDYIVILKSYTDEYEIINLNEVKIEGSRFNNDNPFFNIPWINGGQ